MKGAWQPVMVVAIGDPGGNHSSGASNHGGVSSMHACLDQTLPGTGLFNFEISFNFTSPRPGRAGWRAMGMHTVQ